MKKKYSSEELKDSFDDAIFTVNVSNKEDALFVVEQTMKMFEANYGFDTYEMIKKNTSGEISTTSELSLWIILAEHRDRLLGF